MFCDCNPSCPILAHLGVVLCAAEELFERKRRAKRRWVWRVTPFWVVWEVIVFCIMQSAMVLLAWYVFHLAPATPRETLYDVYDADVSAPARYFMIRKDESGFTRFLADRLRVGTGSWELGRGAGNRAESSWGMYARARCMSYPGCYAVCPTM